MTPEAGDTHSGSGAAACQQIGQGLPDSFFIQETEPALNHIALCVNEDVLRAVYNVKALACFERIRDVDVQINEINLIFELVGEPMHDRPVARAGRSPVGVRVEKLRAACCPNQRHVTGGIWAVCREGLLSGILPRCRCTGRSDYCKQRQTQDTQCESHAFFPQIDRKLCSE